MFGRKMTLKETQKMVCAKILHELSREWQELELDIQETVNSIVMYCEVHENQDLMEDLFGKRFVHLAHLFADSRTLLNDIEELDNE